MKGKRELHLLDLVNDIHSNINEVCDRLRKLEAVNVNLTEQNRIMYECFDHDGVYLKLEDGTHSKHFCVEKHDGCTKCDVNSLMLDMKGVKQNG